jgi:hypothetical protein
MNQEKTSMVGKSKSKTAASKSPDTKANDMAETLAKATLRPSVNAAAVIEAYGAPMGDQDIAALVNALSDSIVTVSNGNMGRCEAMLLGQAHALQAIFMNLSRRAVKQEHLNNFETFLRLALKAQGQCRATIETLVEIKSPRQVAFVQQANIANGPQQVNNGCSTGVAEKPSAREEKPIQSNELLKDTSNETEIIGMDTGTTRSPSRIDPQLEAVGALDGAKHG